MTASLLQLVCAGNEDYYLTSNPNITYFKSVFKKHTPFSIERIKILNNESRKILFNDKKEINFKINSQYSDFLGSIYFNIKLPEIYSHYPYRFLWIKELGSYIIDEASLIIDNQIIETLDSNMIKIINTKNLNSKNKSLYDKLTCNTDTYNSDTGYRYSHPPSRFSANLINNEYSDIPSIPEANIFVKLPFFFSRNTSTKLPLLKLRNSSVNIKITLRPLKQLYILSKIRMIKLGIQGIDYNYLDENTYNLLAQNFYYNNYSDHFPNIYNFSKKPDTFNNLDICLYCYQYFCGKLESDNLIKNNTKFIVSIIKKIEDTGITKSKKINIKDINNLVKEIILVPYRSDQNMRNSWNNYTFGDELKDYNIINKFTHNYLNISYNQYISDLRYIADIKNRYNNKLNSLSQKGIINITIKFVENRNIQTISYDGNILDTGKNWSEYVKCLKVFEDYEINKFVYLGKFIQTNDNSDINLKPIDFRLKLFNDNKNYFYNNENLIYLPSFTSNVDETRVLIDFVNPVYTSSLLKDDVNIPYDNQLTLDEIRKYLSIWPFRNTDQYPDINKKNKGFYINNSIVQEIKLSLDDKEMILRDNKKKIYNIDKFKNNQYLFCPDIITFNFSGNPNFENPTGHLNFRHFKSINLDVQLTDYQSIEKNYNLDYTINVNTYLYSIKLIIIKNSKFILTTYM